MRADLFFLLRQKTRAIMSETSPETMPDNAFLTVDSMLGDADIVLRTHEPEANFVGLHRHDFFEINYVVFGKCHQILHENKTCVMSADNLCMMNPNTVHSLIINSEQDAVINIIVRRDIIDSTMMSFASDSSINGRFFLNYLFPDKYKESNHILLVEPFHSRIDNLIEQLLEEEVNRGPFYKFNMENLLSLLVSAIMEKTLESNIDMKAVEIMEYMTSHLKNATLKNVAEYFKFSPNYMSAYIKKHTGRTFADILTDIRLNYGKKMLLETQLNIEEISEQLGYSDSVSFYNMFKRMTGSSPSSYRYNWKGKQ